MFDRAHRRPARGDPVLPLGCPGVGDPVLPDHAVDHTGRGDPVLASSCPGVGDPVRSFTRRAGATLSCQVVELIHKYGRPGKS